MISIQGLLSDVRRAISTASIDPRPQGAPSQRAPDGSFPAPSKWAWWRRAPEPAGLSPLRLAKLIFFAERRRLASERRLGLPVPRFAILSVTNRCNLRCRGCYAANYPRGAGLSLTTIERVVREARDLGTYLFVIVGGEPLLVPGLVEVLSRKKDAIFFLFTNGTLLDAERIEELSRAPNVLPIVSQEGGSDLTDDRRGPGVGARVEAAVRRLAERGLPYGFAATVTHENVTEVVSRPWFDELWAAGARFGFLLDYVPVSGAVDPALVLSDEDRSFAAKELSARHAEGRPIVVHFPPDEYRDGCQAAGRGFLHINAEGYVEPCPFSHYACDSVEEKSFEDILRSPFFAELRARLKVLPNPHGECLLAKHSAEVEAIARRHGGIATDTSGGMPSGTKVVVRDGRVPIAKISV